MGYNKELDDGAECCERKYSCMYWTGPCQLDGLPGKTARDFGVVLGNTRNAPTWNGNKLSQE